MRYEYEGEVWSIGIGEETTRHRTHTVYEQPAWRHLIAKAYHRWHCLPGPWVRVQEWAWSKREESDEMPMYVVQDLRCYDLTMKGRIEIETETLEEL